MQGYDHTHLPVELADGLGNEDIIKASVFHIAEQNAPRVDERAVEDASLCDGDAVDDGRDEGEEAQYARDDAPDVVTSVGLGHNARIGAPWSRMRGIWLAEWRSQ